MRTHYGRTDGRRTLTHDKSSHGLWPGELIKRNSSYSNDLGFYILDFFLSFSVDKKKNQKSGRCFHKLLFLHFKSDNFLKKKIKLLSTEEKSTTQLQARGCFTLILKYKLCSLLKTLP
jgi:hypothetical protein